MATKYIHQDVTSIVPADNVDAVNTYLDRQGLGACFTIPLVLGAAAELVKDSEPLVTHYGTTLVMTAGMRGMVDRLLAKNGGEVIEQKFRDAMVAKGGERAGVTHPYQVVIVIPVGQRGAVITRLATRFADADSRFFKDGLSSSGSAPAQWFVDWMYAAKSFAPLLDQLIVNVKRAEVFVGVRDGNGDAVRKAYKDPKYQNPDLVNRTFARVWLSKDEWTKPEVLKALNLKTVS